MKKYYLFLYKKEDLEQYKLRFDKVSESIKAGVTPVFNELQSAKTNVIESIPYNLINAIFVILGTLILAKIGINEIISIGITLIINNVFSVIANYIFCVIKHKLRLSLCKRLGVPPTDHTIAVMESMEYQSVIIQ